MENIFLLTLQNKVAVWRDNGYQDVEKETLNILSYIKKIGFLHLPQIQALETYIYIKEILDNKPICDIFDSLFDNEKELMKSLAFTDSEIVDLFYDENKQDKIKARISEIYNGLDYSNQVYALAMGAGKTILMGTFIVYDFVLSYYHPKDKRFAKNALVFAPDTTIIESLKEIKSFDYSKVLPKEYQSIGLNIKYHYLESTDTPLTPIGNYNIVVSNSQKIILKTRHKQDSRISLFRDESFIKNRSKENRRLQSIRELSDLLVLVDEAHHSFGTTLEGNLKKTKETINYIHKEGKTPLIGVLNLTGTPYVNNKMIPDVVYHFGLKDGIEKGILKQVRFLGYSNVKTDEFIDDVVNKFWNEYCENRLEGKLPKIAFYASNIEDLQTELRPKLEVILNKLNISQDKILEFHTSAEKNKDEFLLLDTEMSNKQFILLVGKGTEGWNCRSLVSCALYRKPNSSIFVLQSTTRCLRSIADNSVTATVFLSDENYKILDRELKNNYATTIEDLGNQDQKTVEHTLTVEKKKKIKVKKKLVDIISASNKNLDSFTINWNKFDHSKSGSYISESGIVLNADQKAEYKGSQIKENLKIQNSHTFYTIVEIINRYTQVPCLAIEKIMLNGKSRNALVDDINKNYNLIPYATYEILKNAFVYTEKIEIVEEELELTKMYPFKINVSNNKSQLVVYKTELASGRLGFHINPYNFDSKDEKGLFIYLKEILDADEAVVDIYFTGGITDSTHNDFYFEYYNPVQKKIARYFPDFLIETSRNRFLVVEVKTSQEKSSYEQNKSNYSGKKEELFSEVFAKEVGFREFQEVNKNFEYHIIFDAGLQQQQRDFYEKLREEKK